MSRGLSYKIFAIPLLQIIPVNTLCLQYMTGQYYWSCINFILFLHFARHSC